MIITPEVVKELNQRLQWDEAVDLDNPTPIVYVEYSAQGLREVIEALRPKFNPEILALPWSIVESLIDESNQLFMASPHGQHNGMILVRPDSWEYGFVGHIVNVPVVASIHLGRSNGPLGLLTSAPKPLDISHHNSVWLLHPYVSFTRLD